MPYLRSRLKNQTNSFKDENLSHAVIMNNSIHIFINKIKAGFFMEQALTCANHTEEVVLKQLGWNYFTCPKCGSDYSIGRKVVLLDLKPVQNHKA